MELGKKETLKETGTGSSFLYLMVQGSQEESNRDAVNPPASAQQREQWTEEDAAYRVGGQNLQLSIQLEINIRNIKKP